MPQMFPTPLIILFIYFLIIMLTMTTNTYFSKSPTLMTAPSKLYKWMFKW